MPTISKEDYLKTVYLHISEGMEAATTSGVARELEISNAATSEMAKKLAEQGFLSYARYKGVMLTDEGEKLALQVIRRHRLWELFLMQVLGLSWSEVHDEAEKLEHISSEFLVDKIDEHLGFPEFDPHGSPIPDKDGNIPYLPKTIPLTDADTGSMYKIAKVNDNSSELMEHFTQIGIALNSTVTVKSKLSFDNSVTIEIDGVTHLFSEKIAASINVIKLH